MINHLFVYGTLMSGLRLNEYIHSALKTDAVLRGGFSLLNYKDQFPALIDEGLETDCVLGELYYYDSIGKQLVTTDAIELSSGYERVVVEVEDMWGYTYQAYTYLYTYRDKNTLDTCEKQGDIYSWRYNECMIKMKQFTRCMTTSSSGRMETIGHSSHEDVSESSGQDGSV